MTGRRGSQWVAMRSCRGRDGGALGAQDWVSQEPERPARLGMDHCEVSRRDEIIPGPHGHCEVASLCAGLVFWVRLQVGDHSAATFSKLSINPSASRSAANMSANVRIHSREAGFFQFSQTPEANILKTFNEAFGTPAMSFSLFPCGIKRRAGSSRRRPTLT